MKIYNRIPGIRYARCIALVCIILFCVSCHPAPVSQKVEEPNAVLSVYFFHLTTRCEACNAIEENTIRVLDKYYSDGLKNGIIIFKSINIDNRENRSIVEKYKISYTSLLLIRSDGTITDFTNTALNYANMAPSRFEELLRKEIDKNLE